jgi:hypothetical protein
MAKNNIVKKKTKRGPIRYCFTFADIAQICNLSIEAVYKSHQRKHFDPQDISSVARFIIKNVL